jgi:outer membrane autotransporter protein
MKRKFLAKAITLGLMLAVPLGVEAANVTTEVNNQTITKWGEQTVINGGITNGTIVDNTANGTACQIVQNGGIANDTVLIEKDSRYGGRQNVVDGGTANRTIIGSMARADIRNGSANDFTNNGGELIILEGNVKGTTLNSGTITIHAETLSGSGAGTGSYSGATVSNTIINGGTMKIEKSKDARLNTNATVTGTVMNNGIISIDDSTSKLENTTANGGSIEVYNGTLNNTELKQSSKIKVYEGSSTINGLKLYDTSVVNAASGTFTNVELNNKTSMSLNGANTAASNVSVTGDASDRHSSISTENGASINSLILNYYGLSTTYEGSKVSNVTIKNNAWQGVKGGTVTDVTIEAGGRQTIYDNNKSSNIKVQAGGELVVNKGAVAENVTTDGTIYMRDTGKLSGDTVLGENGNIDLGGIVNGLYSDTKLNGREDSGNYSIDKITSNGGTVSAFGEGQELTIDKLDGSGLTLNTEVAKNGLVKITENNGAEIDIKASAKVTDSFGNDINGGMKKLLDTVQVENGNKEATAVAEAGSVTGEVKASRDSNGNYSGATEDINKENAGISEMASIALMAWRAENNDMNKRLGELRDSKGEHGIWTRMVRGQSKYGAQNVKNQYSTYQLGYDEKLSVDKHWTVGAAVSYTDASSSFSTGHGENKSTGFAVYGSYLSDNGSFVDLIAKAARLKNEFDVLGGAGKGDYETNGYSLSAEYGKRFTKDNGFWIEPQVELTYGYVGAVDYLTNNDVKVRQNGMDSLVGRIGFSMGRNIKAGNVYARASYLYDFDGETDVTFSKNNVTRGFEQDLGGGWWEVGVGTNINLSDATHLYFDVEKTYGGNVATPWQWNAGVRWSF